MKKLLFLFFGLGVLLLLFDISIPHTPISADLSFRLEPELGINVHSGRVIEESDTHGGFHGDGLAFLSLDFSSASLSPQLEGNSAWSPLPLSAQLSALAYGSGTGSIRTGPYLTDGNGAPIFPFIQNGYYYFYDRHDQAEDPRNESAIMGRSSFNLTLALYDTDTDTLYYVKYDT